MIARNVMTSFALVAVTALSAVPASAFTASNYMRVNPVSPDVFEVVAHGGARFSDYWCAAAEYLLYTGSTSATQRIYVVRQLGQAETENRRSAVQFSLNEPEGADTRPGFTMTVKRVGENLSAASARNQCHSRDLRWIP